MAVQTARPQATMVTSSPERRITPLPKGTRMSSGSSGISPRMMAFFITLMSAGSVGSPGKAGPRVWRYIHLGSRQTTGPWYSLAVMIRP